MYLNQFDHYTLIFKCTLVNNNNNGFYTSVSVCVFRHMRKYWYVYWMNASV